MRVYELLLSHFGPQHWWPAETAFDVIVGALLMPQTSWANVERAIANLKEAGLTSPEGIAKQSIVRLRALVKPAGLYRSKPGRLRGFCRHMMRVSGGSVGSFLSRDPEGLRRELLSLEGVGPETADSILLYAAGAKVFVVDAYTTRMGRRVGLFDYDSYDRIQGYFQRNVPRDLHLYQEFHALMVALGKNVCKTTPNCMACPLKRVCRHARSG